MDERSLVFMTAGVIAAYFLLQAVSRRIRSLCPCLALSGGLPPDLRRAGFILS